MGTLCTISPLRIFKTDTLRGLHFIHGAAGGSCACTGIQG